MGPGRGGVSMQKLWLTLLSRISERKKKKKKTCISDQRAKAAGLPEKASSSGYELVWRRDRQTLQDQGDISWALDQVGLLG